jgi:hypothetical protein
MTRVPAIHLGGSVGTKGGREPNDGRTVLLSLKFFPGALMIAISGQAGSPYCQYAPHKRSDQAD